LKTIANHFFQLIYRAFPGKSSAPAEENRKQTEKGPVMLLFLKERFHFPLMGVYYVIAFFSQNWS
jgi:hypothetical protein